MAELGRKGGKGSLATMPSEMSGFFPGGRLSFYYFFFGTSTLRQTQNLKKYCPDMPSLRTHPLLNGVSLAAFVIYRCSWAE